jgi:hypothetical protein
MAEIQRMLNAQDQAVSELRAKLEEMSQLLWPDNSSKG